MLVKIIILFLAAMALLAMVGNLLFPGVIGRRLKPRSAFCAGCGKPRIGKGPCDCGRSKSP